MPETILPTATGGPSRRSLLKGVGTVGAVAVGSTLLAACDSGTSSSTANQAAASGPATTANGGVDLSTITQGRRIGVISLDNSAAAVAVGLQGLAAIKDEIGWETDIVDIKGDPSAVPGAVDTLLSRKAEAILCYALPAPGLDQSIAAAVKAKVPVISLASGRPEGISAVAEFNEWISGARTALYIVQRMNFSGQVALLDFIQLEATAIRSTMVRQVIELYPEIEIVEDITVKVPGQLQDARDRTAAMLGKYPKLKAVWTAFDDIALGANTAIKESGRKDVFVASIDGVPTALEAIRKGEPLAATCYNDQALIMRSGISLADRLIDGKKVPLTTLQDSPIVTSDNVPKDGAVPSGFVTPLWEG